MRGASIAGSLCVLCLTAISAVSATIETPVTRMALPGQINYVEGQAFIGTMPLNPAALGNLVLERSQTLTTQAGKVEILLTPGVFLRLADNSGITMISPDLANIEVRLDKGRAMIEVLNIRKENDIRIDLNGAAAKLVARGLYEFDADLKEVRVFKGSVQVTEGNRHTTFGGAEKLALGGEKLKAVHFETRQYEDDFYRWSALRSGYLSEASVDIARAYLGPGPGWYGPGWYGLGWYWNPWFGVYTFVPVDGIFWSPFGWGFYSPIAVYRSPYFFNGHYPHGFGELHAPYGHGIAPEGGRFGGRR